MKQREKSGTNLYNGMPASSRNHSTIYTLSRVGGISGHGNEIRFPSTACTSIVRTVTKMTQKTHECIGYKIEISTYLKGTGAPENIEYNERRSKALS